MQRKAISSPTDSPHLVQEIYEQTYLRPFDKSKRNKKNLYQLPVERISHGTQHASRVAAYIMILVNFCKSLGYPKEVLSLTQEQINLLQWVAIFHDAARQSDGVDAWEKESAALLEAFLKKMDWYSEESKLFIDCIMHVSHNIFDTLFQSADAVDIMRVKDSLQLEKINLYNQLKPKDKEKFINLAIEIRELIARQHDLKLPCSIKEGGLVIIAARKATRNPNKPEMKQAYEQAENGYVKTTAEIAFFPLLKRYYNENRLFENSFTMEDEEAAEEMVEQTVPQHRSDPSPLSTASMVLSNDNQGCHFCFPTEEKALTCLDYIKGAIAKSCPEIEQAHVVQYTFKGYDSPYHRFSLKVSQWDALRAEVRKKAFTFPNTEEFLAKSIRADKFNYLRHFVDMVMSPFHQHDLRRGPKGNFIVTGEGCFSRQDETVDDFPLKMSQYTAEEKQGFSKFQSTSYGTPTFHPLIFGFDKRKNKLVGVMINTKDALLSDHLYIYDGGTVDRPYYFFTSDMAKQYYQSKINTVLFSAKQLEAFKLAIQSNKNKDKYNEVLARLRWNTDGSSKVFIATDNLETRILAMDYARVIKKQLLQNNLCDPHHVIPIIFYSADPALRFKEYGDTERQMDIAYAEMVYHDVKKRHAKYDSNDYEFLLALPSDKLKAVLSETYQGHLLIFHILSQGYIHIVQSLLEITDCTLPDVITKDELHERNKAMVISSMYYCLATNNVTFAQYLLDNHQLTDLQAYMRENDSHTLMHIVARNGLHDFFYLIASNTKHLNAKDKNGWTPLCQAAFYGQTDMVKALLALTGTDVNKAATDGRTALMLAAGKGYADIVSLLLANVDIQINATNNDYRSALTMAALNDHAHVINILLAQEKIRVNESILNRHSGALLLAVLNNRPAAVAALIASDKTDVNIKTLNGQSALVWAASLGHIKLVNILLTRADLDINIMCGFNQTALTLAATVGHLDVVYALLQDQRIDANVVNRYDETALVIAVANNHVDIIKALLDHEGINVEGYIPFSSMTPLATAALFFQPRAYDIGLSLLNDLTSQTLARLIESTLYLPENEQFLFSYLERYHQRRTEGQEYKHWYGSVFGQPKAIKLSASQFLLDNWNNNDLESLPAFELHTKALGGGELKQLFALYKLVRANRPILHDNRLLSSALG